MTKTAAPATTAVSATSAYTSNNDVVVSIWRPYRRPAAWALFLFCALFCTLAGAPAQGDSEARAALPWSDSEVRLLRTLSLAALPPVRPDWRNPLAGNLLAAELGAALFRDQRLSGDGTMACQTCHSPQRSFQDGLPTSRGQAPLARNAPSLIGSAHRAWLYWDGRKDSLWAQALEPIEAAAEMNGTRTGVARLLSSDARLHDLYQRAFGAPAPAPWRSWPARATPRGGAGERAAWDALDPGERHRITRLFVHAGMAIAAFEATLAPEPTRFDRFVAALVAGDRTRADALLDAREQRGLRRFISGDTGCATCHLGPRFTTDTFRNIGTGGGAHGAPDAGRWRGRELVAADEFNCRSVWSPDPAACRHLDSLKRVEVPALLNGAFRTPTLRNLVHTAPYMHDGRHATLEQVLQHYVDPPPKDRVHHELPVLMRVSEEDAADIVAFLKTLSADQPMGLSSSQKNTGSLQRVPDSRLDRSIVAARVASPHSKPVPAR